MLTPARRERGTRGCGSPPGADGAAIRRRARERRADFESLRPLSAAAGPPVLLLGYANLAEPAIRAGVRALAEAVPATGPEWANTTVLRGDVGEAVRGLEQRHQEIMLQDSAQLADALLELGLADEWRLMTFPVVVGKGKRCFGDPGRAVNLRLVDSRAVGDGVQIVVYAS